MSTAPPAAPPAVRMVTHSLGAQNGIGATLRTFFEHNPGVGFTVWLPDPAPRDLPPNVRAVAIRSFRRPLVLLYVSFRAAIAAHRRSRGSLESDLPEVSVDAVVPGRILWLHFAHRHYLRHIVRGTRPRSLAEAARRLDHAVRARFEPRLTANAELIVVPTARLARDLGADERRVLILPNLPIASRVWRPADGRDPSLGVVVAGGAFERKGVFDAVAALHDAPGVRLRVLGGGAHDLRLARAAAERIGVSERLELLGWVDQPLEQAARCGFAVFPSRYEVASIALLEAVYGGMPVVARAVGEAADLIEDGVNGILVASGDPAELAAALMAARSLADDRVRAAASALRKRRSEEYARASDRLVHALGARR